MTEAKKAERIVTEVFEESFQLFIDNIVLFILSGLLHIFLSIVTLGIMAGPLTVGFLDQVRRRRLGEPVEIGDIFRGTSQFGSAFVAMLVMVVLVPLGYLCLILPGIFLTLAWFCAFAVMTYEQTGAMASLARSYELFKENMAIVAVMTLLVIVIGSLGSLVVFGSLITSPFSLVVVAVFYEKLTAPRALQAHGVDVP